MKHQVRERNQDNLKAFGEHLRKLRESKGLSQEELAYRAQVAYSSINKLENGKLNTSISTLFDLADALRIEKTELLNF
ncbi:MAG: helix-turn-helix transcriptional regulator [Bacteroidota bacterium]